MSALSTYAKNKIVDAMLRGQSITFPTTIYLALRVGATEVSGGSYARVAVTCSLTNFSGTQSSSSTTASSGTSGRVYLLNDATFPAPTANWGTVTATDLYDAPTGGNVWLSGNLTANVTINNGDPAKKFAAGDLSYQIDN